MKVSSSFNRNAPLFEKQYIPFEFLQVCDENKGGIYERGVPKRRLRFALRLLQGNRNVPNNVGATERAIRLEISDEYRKCTELNGMDEIERRNSIHAPMKVNSENGNMPMSIRFPVLQDRSNFVQNNDSKKKSIDITRCEEGIVVIDKSPVNIYELEVGESDFAQLQQDQALLVDFSNFSKSIIDLLSHCDLGDSDEEDIIGRPTFFQYGSHHMNQNNSKFFCRIEDFSSSSYNQNSTSWKSQKEGKLMARFSIVESNQFRELVHLSLDMRSGTDASVRSYLSERLSDMLVQTSMLKFQLKVETDRGDTAEKTCTEMTHQYNEMIQMSESEKLDLVQKADESIQKENAKRCEELQLIKKMNEEEIKSLKDENKHIRDSFQSQIDTYDKENRQLIESNQEKDKIISHLETLINEATANEEKFVAANRRLETDISKIQDIRNKLLDELQMAQKKIAHLESQNSQLEKSVCRTEGDLEESKRDAAQMRQNAENSNQQLLLIQQDLMKHKGELDQTKELLARYQRDRLEMKRRLKEKVERIQQQEDILSKNEIKSSANQKILHEKNIEIERLEKALKESTAAFEKISKELDEKQKTLSSNQQVIAWLNKEANNKPKYSAISGPNFAHQAGNLPNRDPIRTIAPNHNPSPQRSPAQYITPESFKAPPKFYLKQPNTIPPQPIVNRYVPSGSTSTFLRGTPVKPGTNMIATARPQSSSSMTSLPRQSTPPVAIPQPTKEARAPPTV